MMPVGCSGLDCLSWHVHLTGAGLGPSREPERMFLLGSQGGQPGALELAWDLWMKREENAEFS